MSLRARIPRVCDAAAICDRAGAGCFRQEFEMRGEGLLARAFCHEIDHLNGVLFIQHLSMLKRDLIKRKIRKLKKAGEW